MGKRRRDREGPRSFTDWSTERTLADAEADAALAADEEALQGAPGLDTPFETARVPVAAPTAVREAAARCACGSEEFLLEAYLAVIGGQPQPEPVELEALTCPQCGREYEAIWLADGRVARGDYRGQADLDE